MRKIQLESEVKNLVMLSSAKLLSGFACYIYDVGIVIYLYEKTQSVAIIGGFFVSQLLPAFIILLSGQLIDKYNKKNLIVFSNLAKGGILLILLFNRNIWSIYMATFLFNFLLEFEGNTFSSLMISIFPKDKILKSASVINLLDSLSMVLAPVSASFIAMHFKFTANLILDIILFIITAFIYFSIHISHQKIEKEEKSEGTGKGNIKVLGNKKILLTVLFWNIFMLCIGITAPLEISMIEDTLNMPSSYYGIGNTVEGIGMLLASGFILGIIRKLRSNTIIMIGLFSAALSYLVIGLSGNIEIYMIGACLVGMTSTFCPLGFKTEVQINSNPSIIGRTFTTARFTVLLSRIAGSFIVGFSLDLLGIRKIYYSIAGILTLAAVVYAKEILDQKSR